jgi:hypothetical protein
MQAVDELITRWQDEAAVMEKYGDARGASIVRLMVGELRAAMDAQEEELLSAREAAKRTGYHEDTIGRWLADGTIPNQGKRNRPLVRAGDLPRKPSRSRVARSSPAPDADALLQRILDSKKGRG